MANYHLANYPRTSTPSQLPPPRTSTPGHLTPSNYPSPWTTPPPTTPRTSTPKQIKVVGGGCPGVVGWGQMSGGSFSGRGQLAGGSWKGIVGLGGGGNVRGYLTGGGGQMSGGSCPGIDVRGVLDLGQMSGGYCPGQMSRGSQLGGGGVIILGGSQLGVVGRRQVSQILDQRLCLTFLSGESPLSWLQLHGNEQCQNTKVTTKLFRLG